MFGRRHINTRRELVRAELGESLDLFRQAAVHAAGGLGATVGPRYGAAREKIDSARGYIGPAGRITNAASTSWDTTIATLAPFAEAIRQGSVRARELDARNAKGSRFQWIRGDGSEDSGRASGTIVVLLATGAAVGAIGALVVRRRNRAKWAEYEPSSLDADVASFGDTTKPVPPVTSSTYGTEQSPTTKVTGWAKDQSKSAYDSVRHKIHKLTADRNGNGSQVMAEARQAMTRKTDQIGEGARHLADKATGKTAPSEATGRKAPSEATAPADDTTSRGTGESVDDLLRSAKNGRM